MFEFFRKVEAEKKEEVFMSASFCSLKFSLESQNAQFDRNMNKDQPTGTRAADFPRCAIVESSTGIFTQIEFQHETIISPLLITWTDSSADTSSSVRPHPVLHRNHVQTTIVHCSCCDCRFGVDLVSLLGESGIVSTVNSKSSSPLLTTIVTTSHFHNLTATPLLTLSLVTVQHSGIHSGPLAVVRPHQLDTAQM
ncbi:hypothetical protein BLNAU_22969 [Blattamonas nauphoetae]|uniref:Uncharacterized protein n=1 Tax=Blattamonas nauphoetae TaxID=2049346 RepID=A0ABQ9WRK1_9EUKA|nr:hypothetical protein BLNAU_22969 [Blattamonas nauphoetae]